MITINLVGGEKGGIGKSVLSRILVQYHIDRNIPFKAFDADLSHGALMRYYGEFSEPVNIQDYESADTIVEQAAESGENVVVDLPAQASAAIERWVMDSGLTEFGDDIGVKINLWHVMDDGTDSVRLLNKVLNVYGNGLNYILVKNHGRGSDFSYFDLSEAKERALSFGAQIIDLPALQAGAMRKIDRIGASLWAAANNKDEALGPTLGMLERQRVRVWLANTYKLLDEVFVSVEETTEV